MGDGRWQTHMKMRMKRDEEYADADEDAHADNINMTTSNAMGYGRCTMAYDMLHTLYIRGQHHVRSTITTTHHVHALHHNIRANAMEFFAHYNYDRWNIYMASRRLQINNSICFYRIHDFFQQGFILKQIAFVRNIC